MLTILSSPSSLMWKASAMVLLAWLSILSRISVFEKSKLCPSSRWCWVRPVFDSFFLMLFWCSLILVFSIRPVCPTYTFPSSVPHGTAYTTFLVFNFGIGSFIDRAIKLTDASERPKTITTVKQILLKNHYPKWFITKLLKNRTHQHYNTIQWEETGRKEMKFVSTPYIPCLSEKLSKILNKHNITLAHKPRDKIKNTVFSRLKDPIPKLKTKNVVYAVPCGTEDGKVYVGQTGRMLKTRINEHQNNIRKKESKTGLTQHHRDEGHNFDFSNTEILERIDNQASRTIAEAFHIKLLGDDKIVNMQRECGGIDSAYNGLVGKIRTLSTHTSRPNRVTQPNQHEDG
ncbi:uncharacterized protein LOC134291234 [Aedes albopictus]|uniref:GIY-YIG domain-containing protein n=1 Tax=Aedes albopictus TaxID=7160 RepID=A0ABM1YH21_AEDAL